MKKAVEVEAFVLAGGKSSRMGRDKGLTLLNGRPMVSYVLKALSKTKIPVKIIANDREYENFNIPVYSDIVAEKGPMGGLFTALSHTKAEAVFLISCDMPLVTAEAIVQLLEFSGKERIVAVTVQGRINPLFAIYPVILKEEVEKRIREGNLKMTDFILENKHTLVPSIVEKFPEIFQNVNTPEELKMTEKKWKDLR
ncbi:molybdenum cofactor guanylyltransferase [Antarcticibacterium flavum]|uniref:Probable molybdenum cofactor guanylyltransferase n=1 Tax=Antarcticibacterium flavum TaxID=2058175 RepID=A0A5B7X5P0_9FLAO|nr:molybdenum cofactor guanylyltransferase [Antarcticibacterium flavum]MCM4158292.1 molybdopterin-guanine dinucleotide biosynthesis protein MobA [Antarcticibacterium sp. W02-3]QCY70058.1 molybdenum cofactor guanylyltransferase [Antarcticibacterium flavum]